MTKSRLVSLTFLLITVAHTRAGADGMFVWRNEQVDIREPEQKALLLFDDGLEDLVLEVRYEGAAGDFGWIIPVPSPPRMRSDDPRLFVQLSMRTQSSYSPRSERGRRMTVTMGSTFGPEVQVLQQTTVGIYDAAVLRAGGAAALARWLDDHGYRAPPGSHGIFADYARRGWVFVALRISPAHRDSATRSSLASGSAQPIRLRFRTPEPVYPLRVSALGRSPSQVLLYVIARRPLVHRTCNRASWTENACGPASEWLMADPDSAFPALQGNRGFLTKLRATVRPFEMEDVYFKPYDPLLGFPGPDGRRRIEAVAHLGLLKPPGAAARLATFLETRPGEGTEPLTALWALGEVGGSDAVRALMRQAERGPWLARLEAIESLSRLRVPEAFPVYVRGLRPLESPFQWLRSRDEWKRDAVIEACADHLTAQGDSTCIPPLRRMLGREPQPKHRYYSPSLHDRVLAALAASGDAEARDTIVRRIAAEGAVKTGGALRFRHTGSINGFPSGFWPAVHLIDRRPNPGGWDELNLWHDLLAGRPDVHDDVLRRAAADRTTTDLARVVLLGMLAKPGPDDARPALMLARRGLGVDSLWVTLRAGDFHETSVRYNVPVCVAAYALGRQRAIEALVALWRECPTDDRDMRGELAVALCKADSDVAIPPLLEYVRTEWNTRAASSAYVDDVLASIAKRPSSALTCDPGEYDLRGIDVAYRVAGITGQFERWLGPERYVSLATDPSLHPWLRLFWIHRMHVYTKAMRPWVPTLRRSLDELARTTHEGDLLRGGIEAARRRLDIGDKVYAEDVAPGASEWK